MTKNLVQNPQDQAKWENAKLTFIENAIEKNRNPKTRLMRSLGLISRFSMGIFLTLAATAYSAIPAVFFTKGQNGNTHATNYYQLLIPFTFVSTGALLAWKGGAPFNFLNQKDKIDKQIIKTLKTIIY
ncbi:hypothetical protein KAU11_01385 [Candidatus Babeliales bacterium]|nr:hypothetical protein [Candidatus Babeliales bacterium]